MSFRLQRFYSDSPEYRNYVQHMLMRFNRDYDRRRSNDSNRVNPIEEKEEQQPLAVQSTELYITQNAQQHHTERFELVNDARAAPILRRGQEFYVAVRFDRKPDLETDTLRLICNFGPRPAVNASTRVIMSVINNDHLEENHERWDARISHIDENTIVMQIKTSISSPVGIWKFVLQTGLRNTRRVKDFTFKHDFYLLFNPWSPYDQVYLDDEELRREYVENDVGKVYMGSYSKPKERRWIFGQYDDAVLPTVMLLLEKSLLRHSDRGNPVQVARALSAIVNSNDDNGLLMGRWDGEYQDGVSPFAWTGTIGIMERYLKSGGQSVQYGQCWVFSAATVTICRALGIPARAVTNYVSAHDTNSSLTLDKYFSTDGEEIIGGPDGECYDSCWNFHVWSDVWMARPDLPPGYGGWQIIDATPQEPSQDMFRCGPASVEAVRKGEVGYAYDTPFVFSEVNADICHFAEDESSPWGFSRLRLNQYHVGKLIVTKKPGVDLEDGSLGDMEDVTHVYKNPEGSHAERLAVYNAVRAVRKAQLHYAYPETPASDVIFDLAEIESLPFGAPVIVRVTAENTSNETRTITAVLSASSVFYTGSTAHRLKKAQGSFALAPGARETLEIQVAPDDYIYKLVDHNLIKIYAIANVEETKQTWSEEDDFPFEKPSLDIFLDGELRVGKECTAKFTFRNPLNVVLTNCSVSVEGPGLQRPKVISHRDVLPQEEVSFTEAFYPRVSGERKILAVFNTKPLAGMTGSATVVISDN